MSKKNDAALHGLTKKERKALEARAAQIQRELTERAERKAAKKAKKGKAALAVEPPDLMGNLAASLREAKKAKKAKPAAAVAEVIDIASKLPVPDDAAAAIADAKAARKAAREAKVDPIAAHGAELHEKYGDDAAAGSTAPPRGKVLKKGEVEAAADADIIDAQIKARLREKAAERERDARLAEMPAKVKKARDERHGIKVAAKLEGNTATMPDDLAPGTYDVTIPDAVMGERVLAEVTVVAPQAAEIVETEHGREFAVGTSVAADVDFAKPSEAPVTDFATNGNHQYLVARPEDGKLVGYTRWTTYIDCLSDKTAIEKWKARIILEGVAAIEEGAAETVGAFDSVTARVNFLIGTRDAALAKARKADRKGKLVTGQLAHLVDAAWGEFKKALNALADDVFEVGGGREKAQKGTDLHALTDLYDTEGIAAVGDLLTEGKITPADMADVEAYAEAMRILGVTFRNIERVVVNDDLKVAGRLDRTGMVRLPEYTIKNGGLDDEGKPIDVVVPAEVRARHRVLDLKTGRVDFDPGKIAQQLEGYAGSKGYDLVTHEREDLKLDRTTAILVHLPAGTGTCTVHVVDLVLGRKGNKLAGEVRAWRNEGKRSIDLKTDVIAEIKKATDVGPLN